MSTSPPASPPRPNLLLVLCDDMGFSDLGSYGGEVQTPHLDRLAAGGVRFTQFYNCARCCPARASLLTGLYPHQTGVGLMTGDDGLPGYRGDLNDRCVTIAEVLHEAGYGTYMSGKWHVTRHLDGPRHNWPCQRGFDEFFGTINGGGSYFTPGTLTRNNLRLPTPEPGFYYTDAISHEAAGFIRKHRRDRPQDPFFVYTAYTAPHWPLQALPEDLERYRGRFDAGWDRLREERLERLIGTGLLEADCPLSQRDPRQPPWEDANAKEWQRRRMEVYAAQVDRVDQGLGQIVTALEETHCLDDTLIMFLADNGGCAEELSPGCENWVSPFCATTADGRPVRVGNDPEVLPGDEDTFQSYGVPWANLSNTPFRYYKHWIHEGGIATPFLAHWPRGLVDAGAICHQVGHLMDLMPTCLDVAGASYPEHRNGVPLPSPEGLSLIPALQGEGLERGPLFWEHHGNAGVREGDWKLVRSYPDKWELYNLADDRTELNDLANSEPARVTELAGAYDSWTRRCQVVPVPDLQAHRQRRRNEQAS